MRKSPAVPGHPDRVSRSGRTVEQLADVVPMVQILDTPGMLGGNQVVEVLRMLDVPVIEQVIAVPKISLDWVPQRSALPVPQTAEQLVEVPTNPGYTLAVVASKLCSRREIRRIHSGLGSTASGFGQVVDNSVPQGRRGNGGGLQGSLPVQNSAAVVEQIVDIPARRSLPDFLTGQGSSSSSSSRLLDDADEDFTRVFRTFPRSKKSVKLGSHSRSELLSESSPSTRRAYEDWDAPG